MTIDFGFDGPLEALRTDVRRFMDERVLPVESKILSEDRAGSRATFTELRGAAKAAGLYVPHLPVALGGKGLGTMGMCALFREMGRSLLGPKVFNCDAPDQGNMDLLQKAGTAEQHAKYLRPLAEGAITSAFSMTEPAPGAGADPSNLKTVAREDAGGWVIDGHKWFTTGGSKASFFVLMARTSDDPRTGASLFLVDRDAPGLELVRDVPVMGPDLLDHKESELRFSGVRVGKDAVLGGVGQGFRLAQARLVPARLTHCMRWLGLATRTLELCRPYVTARKSFGKPLAEHQLVQRLFSNGASAIHAGHMMTLHAAWMIERGDDKSARVFSSMTKNQVARTLCQVLDDAIQMHGALGYSEDMPFSSWYRSARAARIADGPDEVHEMLIAREMISGALDLLGPWAAKEHT